MKRFAAISVLACLALLVAGCATLADAKAAKGSGETRIYAHSKDIVWSALVEVVSASDLEIVSEDLDRGILLAQRAITAFSYGENVAVFVEAVDGRAQTTVEVVNKRALATNITAANWPKRIFAELDAKLGMGDRDDR